MRYLNRFDRYLDNVEEIVHAVRVQIGLEDAFTALHLFIPRTPIRSLGTYLTAELEARVFVILTPISYHLQSEALS